VHANDVLLIDDCSQVRDDCPANHLLSTSHKATKTPTRDGKWLRADLIDACCAPLSQCALASKEKLTCAKSHKLNGMAYCSGTVPESCTPEVCCAEKATFCSSHTCAHGLVHHSVLKSKADTIQCDGWNLCTDSKCCTMTTVQCEADYNCPAGTKPHTWASRMDPEAKSLPVCWKGTGCTDWGTFALASVNHYLPCLCYQSRSLLSINRGRLFGMLTRCVASFNLTNVSLSFQFRLLHRQRAMLRL
jgi:hypothetical protein